MKLEGVLETNLAFSAPPTAADGQMNAKIFPKPSFPRRREPNLTFEIEIGFPPARE
jgi:hypothetical protein